MPEKLGVLGYTNLFSPYDFKKMTIYQYFKDKYVKYASSVCAPVAITSSAIGINACAITAGIKTYKSIIKKKKKKHNKVVLLGKDKLNTIERIISKALTD